jgi:plastocyanin
LRAVKLDDVADRASLAPLRGGLDMAIIDIIRKTNQNGTTQVVFDPPVLQVVKGDAVLWRNKDPQQSHWITRKDKGKEFWFDTALAPFVDGAPVAVTSAIVIVEEGDIYYVCDTQGGEAGWITTSVAVAGLDGNAGGTKNS